MMSVSVAANRADQLVDPALDYRILPVDCAQLALIACIPAFRASVFVLIAPTTHVSG